MDLYNFMFQFYMPCYYLGVGKVNSHAILAYSRMSSKSKKVGTCAYFSFILDCLLIYF